MTALSIHAVSKRFGAAVAVDAVSVDVDEGEVCVLLGPSGCGKSTLLRIVAGLEEPDAGRITLRSRDITGLEPRDRDVAMVFQSYALYPHMTVRDNLAFPLRVRKAAAVEVGDRVRAAAALLGLDGLLDRRPAALSGGERQRVAIGRAIVRRPALFLFDEPLSNLDAQLRARMRVELAELFARLGTAVLYVTHDQVEAMTLGRRIVLLRDGRVEQAGTPADLYGRPETLFAATFVGTPPMNVIDLAGAGTSTAWPAPPPAGAASAGIRPEDLRVAPDGPWETTVELVEHLGAESVLHVRLGGTRLQARLAGPPPAGAGSRLRWRPARLHYFDRAGRRVGEWTRPAGPS
jgi:ABC-type sugar transport system ATPase subunit